MNNPLLSLTSQQLNRAADLKERIDALNKEITALLGTTEVGAPKTVRMSAKAKANIGAAQKARWTKVSAAKPQAKAVGASVKAPVKTSMSATAKAKLSALAKARWAKIKGSGKKTL